MKEKSMTQIENVVGIQRRVEGSVRRVDDFTSQSNRDDCYHLQ